MSEKGNGGREGACEGEGNGGREGAWRMVHSLEEERKNLVRSHITYFTADLLMNAHSSRAYGHMHTNAHTCTHTKIHQGRRVCGKWDVLRAKRQGWLAAEWDADRWWCGVYGACGLAHSRTPTIEANETYYKDKRDLL